MFQCLTSLTFYIITDPINKISPEYNWKCEWTSGVVEFHCLLCKYRSYQSHNMKSHINCKHSLNPVKYNCPHCPYSPKHKSLLKNHLKVKHEGLIHVLKPWNVKIKPRTIVYIEAGNRIVSLFDDGDMWHLVMIHKINNITTLDIFCLIKASSGD